MTFINDLIIRIALGLKRLKDERGQDLLEYALLGGLIAVAILAAIGIFTGALNDMFTGIKNCVDFTNTTVCNPGP